MVGENSTRSFEALKDQKLSEENKQSCLLGRQHQNEECCTFLCIHKNVRANKINPNKKLRALCFSRNHFIFLVSIEVYTTWLDVSISGSKIGSSTCENNNKIFEFFNFRFFKLHFKYFFNFKLLFKLILLFFYLLSFMFKTSPFIFNIFFCIQLFSPFKGELLSMLLILPFLSR